MDERSFSYNISMVCYHIYPQLLHTNHLVLLLRTWIAFNHDSIHSILGSRSAAIPTLHCSACAHGRGFPYRSLRRFPPWAFLQTRQITALGVSALPQATQNMVSPGNFLQPLPASQQKEQKGSTGYGFVALEDVSIAKAWIAALDGAIFVAVQRKENLYKAITQIYETFWGQVKALSLADAFIWVN